MWLTPIIPDLCTSVYTYTTHPPVAHARPHARQAHMQAQTCVRHVVSADCVYASTMREESATKTVLYLQLETVMQSVAAVYTAQCSKHSEIGVCFTCRLHFYPTPIGGGGCFKCPRLDVSKPRVYM